MILTKAPIPKDHFPLAQFFSVVQTDGPSMLRLMGVRDVMTFVRKGTENKERTITNNRVKVKVKVKVRENVLMSAVAGQMEGDVRYVPIFFEALFYISQKIPSDQRTIRNIWMHHPLQRSRISLLQLPKVRQFANFLNLLQLKHRA